VNGADHRAHDASAAVPHSPTPNDRASLHRDFMQSTALSRSLLDALTACLHESVVGCFDSPDMLTARGNDDDNDEATAAAKNKAKVSASVAQEDNKQTPVTMALSTEVQAILQRLAALRNQKELTVDSSGLSLDGYDSYNPKGHEQWEEGMYDSNTAAYGGSRHEGSAGHKAEAEVEVEVEQSADWVRCYDETSGNYYFYSETLGESRWEE
jgi:hypothetical protein